MRMGWTILQSFSKRRCYLHFRDLGVRWNQLRYLHDCTARKFCSDLKSTESITGDYNRKPPPWNVMFFGTDEFSLKSLEVLQKEQLRGGLIRRLDVVSVALKKPITAVRRYCRKEGLEVNEWPVTVPEGVYDLGVVASFGHLIPASVINAFPMGIVNVHVSLLPRWRGAAPVIHALLNQDSHTGITLMRIAPYRFDVGDLVRKVVVPVEWDTKSKELTAQLAELGAQELLAILPNLPQHLREAHPQPLEGITKAPKVNEATSKARWAEWSCTDVQAHYRALDDYIPLWSLWHGTPVRLRSMVMHKEWSSINKDAETLKGHPQVGKGGNIRKNSGAKNFSGKDDTVVNRFVMEDSTKNQLCDNVIIHNQQKDEKGMPGSVVYDKMAREIRVCCRDGWVAFQHVMLKGRKLMTAQDFYNGFMSKVSDDSHRFT